mmetsp:Transcript_13633/g.24044  ORF Transcript_13633/g.24044 Transcript_13633/m.24044 type:complete len:209 (+) Transcript_13633:438-1064(+)
MGSLNGVNMATAVHRIARCHLVSQGSDDLLASSTWDRMLTNIEDMAKRRTSSMPVNCTSIIAWACATIGVFRMSLFSALASRACNGIRDFQPYEVTNIMWAYAEFTQTAKQITEPMKNLCEAVAKRLSARRQGEFKVVSLISALLSLSKLADCDSIQPIWSVDLKTVCSCLSREIVSRKEELPPAKFAEMTRAFTAMHKLGISCSSGF